MTESQNTHPPYIAVTHGIRGYFAVLIAWDKELECYTPWNSSPLSFATRGEANLDAKEWAEAEELECKI